MPVTLTSIELKDTEYRNLTTGSRVDATVALDEDGLLNDGYCSNMEFFIRTAGMDSWISPIAIFQYIYNGLTDIITELPDF